MSSLSIFREPAVRRARQEPVCGKSDWRMPTRLQSVDTNVASRLLTGWIERAQFTPAQPDELRPQPAIMRTDAKAPDKPACHFIETPSHAQPDSVLSGIVARVREFSVFKWIIRAISEKPKHTSISLQESVGTSALPQKQTLELSRVMSALCHKRTHVPHKFREE